MTVVARVTAPLLGKRRWQPLWSSAHRVALMGRNFGEAEWERSGELFALEHARRLVPNAPVVLDVGANVGGWSLAARRTWPRADIHAFEPAAATYGLLSAAVQDANVTAVRAACGASPGVVTLHSVPGLPGLTSVYPRDLVEHHLKMSGTEDVPMITVDDYCSDNGIDRVDFLKVDAEGHDLAVLQGASSMIEKGRIHFVQFEFGGANIDSRTFLRDFVRLLEPSYALSRLLVNGLEPLVYSEAEEIFVTANFLAEVRLPGVEVRGSTKT